MRVAWITAFVLPLVGFAGCGGSGSGGSGCKKDIDCKGDRICVSGSCVSSEAGTSNNGNADGAVGSDAASSTGTGGRGGGGAPVTGGAPGTGGAGPVGDASGSGGAAPVADAGPECTRTDLSGCPPGFPFGACCTRAGRCGTMVPLAGCQATGPAPGDAGTGPGGGIVSPQCASCRAASCGSEASACNANAKCKALSSCIDTASPFNILQCPNIADQPTTTLYDALSSCATTHCTGCPSINL